MTPVIIPKSDQINADDFISGPRSYVIGSVAITPGTEQPVSISLVGEKRVWRPCKSMSRVLVAAWGADAKAYAGRSVTLYRDQTVKWGGLEVGGIRISHMSHIERDLLLQLTATKGRRAPHVVRVLAAQSQAPEIAPKLTDGLESALRITEDEAASIRVWLDATASDEVKFHGAFGKFAGYPGPTVGAIEAMTPQQYEAAIFAFEKKAQRGAI